MFARRIDADVKPGKKVELMLVNRGGDLTYVGAAAELSQSSSVADDLVVAIALQIEQRREIVVIDGGAGRGRDHRLGVIGHAQAGAAGSSPDRWRRRPPPGFRRNRCFSCAAASSSACSLASRPRIGVPTSPVSASPSSSSVLPRST